MVKRTSATALAALMVLVLLAGCGGSDKKTAASGSDRSAATDGGSSGGNGSDLPKADGGEFCQKLSDSSDLDKVGSDPASAKAAIERLKKLDPPDAIKDDWGTFLDALGKLAQANPNNPADYARYLGEYGQAAAKVGLYIASSCASLSSSALSDAFASLSDLSDAFSS